MVQLKFELHPCCRLAGLILDILMAKYKDLAVYQPVINGVGGNLVSVQASRLSTELHKDNELGTLPPTARICISPLDAFFSKRKYSNFIFFSQNNLGNEDMEAQISEVGLDPKKIFIKF